MTIFVTIMAAIMIVVITICVAMARQTQRHNRVEFARIQNEICAMTDQDINNWADEVMHR